ncbi:cache domain-containing sensor histidine kinase [Paenibacillus silvisoli]|uniref:cache domain-containing sensor histidine kinase n=1 Tax=Paenibacillus silvisoli TaxID=3110539 RepID=UPI002803ECBE|nr:histidine kinase [Paenibacillus silvisoli]
MKIKTKLFLVTMLTVVLLLSALTYLMVKRSSMLITEHVKESAAVSLSQIAQNLDQQLASYEEIAYSLYLNTTIQEKMLHRYADYNEAYEQYFQYLKPYVSIVQATKDIYRMVFYSTNKTFLFSNILELNAAVREPGGWHERLLQSPTGNYWTNEEDERWTGLELFSLKQKLNYKDPGSELLVSIEMNKAILYNLVNEESKGKRIIIALANGEVLLDTEARKEVPAFLHEYAFYPVLEQSGISPQGYSTYEGNDETYWILRDTLNKRNAVKGIQVVMMVPVSDLLPEIRSTRNLAMLLLAAACLVSFIVIYASTYGLMRRLTELSLKMRRVHEDNFQSFVDVKGVDEVSQLGHIFNRMVAKTDKLIQDVYVEKLNRKELELRTKEAELYALQNQVNPHFLFNVLNTIRGNLLEQGDQLNARIVSQIAKSFRIMLKKRSAIVTLRDEYELVLIYLEIQKYRYGERLSFELSIPEQLMETQVPSMSLQPIVENVFSHVLEAREEQTHITISAEQGGDAVFIHIQDNGPPIPDDRLREINGWLSEDRFVARDKHLGLLNVHQRLRMMFRQGSSLRVKSGPEGTKVTIIVGKARTESDEDA